MTTAVDVLPGVALRRHSWLRNEFLPLYQRALRISVRVPTALIPPLFIPVFFLVVNTAALKGITRTPGFPTDDYIAFFLPVSLLMTVTQTGVMSGMSLVQDLVQGYLDKLLLAPVSRTSILIARLATDGTRAAVQALLVLFVGVVILGAGVETGILGALVLVIFGFLFALAYAGIGLTIALRTGSAEATQASFVIFFPLVFLAPTFVPLEGLPGWLQAAARVNPVTYVMEGMRSLLVTGWDFKALGLALLVIALIATATLASAFASLRARAGR